MTRTCSDKVYSVPFLPCSNFQSSAMFEGSECVEVEGGSTESTVASSISACKKVRKKKRSCLSCVCVVMEVYIYLCVPASMAACQPRPPFAFFSARAHVHLSIISVSPVICWCAFPAVQEIFISSSGVPVCNKRNGQALGSAQ